MHLISPLGGKLINRAATGSELQALREEAKGLVKLRLPEREQCDVEMIAIGAYSPLTGFMGSLDFHSVCDHMKFGASGLPWPIPVTCSTDRQTADRLALGQRICLTDDQGKALAVLTIEEKYPHDKAKECEKVYRTSDPAHPGVKVTMEQGDVCLAGPISVIAPCYDPPFAEHRLTPPQTRAAFAERGWKTVVAFQTRNPIHRAHEYLTKCALEICDGLLIHPLVGQTQEGDIPADVRMHCYQEIISKYYSAKHTVLSVMPAAMRYAGPREAVLHAITRRNYGCTHFIVGRDHAGVGNYYGTYDAQTIFDEINPEEDHGIGIVPLKFEHSVWCNKCQSMVSVKTCPHEGGDHVFLSGKKVREMLVSGQRPPQEFSRPEIADILIAAEKRG